MSDIPARTITGSVAALTEPIARQVADAIGFDVTQPLSEQQQTILLLREIRDLLKVQTREKREQVIEYTFSLDKYFRNTDLCQDDGYLFVPIDVTLAVQTPAGTLNRVFAAGWNILSYPAGTTLAYVSGQPETLAIYRRSSKVPL